MADDLISKLNALYVDKITNIFDDSYSDLNNVLESWCLEHEGGSTGGQMRNSRGNKVELFVQGVIEKFKTSYGINVYAKIGETDKKDISIGSITKEHQVDIHIYKDDKFIAVIECKSYLDKCYYGRACNDFKTFKDGGCDLKYFVFSLERSIKEDTKDFLNAQYQNVCDEIFYVLDGSRSSKKPIYDRRFKKPINKDKLKIFIKSMQKLFDLN